MSCAFLSATKCDISSPYRAMPSKGPIYLSSYCNASSFIRHRAPPFFAIVLHGVTILLKILVVYL